MPIRTIPLVALLAIPAAALAQEKPGDRTATPAEILGQAAAADPLAENERIAAAAAVHPLGSVENPIRVGGPDGARSYIARLRCADGSPPAVGGASPGGVGAYGTVTQLYALDCRGAGPGRASIAVDLYHEEHVETRAAAGFSIDAR